MSKILENWESGLGLPGVLVIDGHTHIGAWRHAATFQSVEDAAEQAVAFMDANGIDAACSMSGGYTQAGADYRLGNDFLLAVCERTPDRLIGFANINPNDTPEAIITELDRVFDAGIRCIKLINAYQENYPGDGPNLMKIYEYAAGHKMLILNHAWTADVIMRIAVEFPSVDFICGHYNARYNPILKARGNVYANIWGYGDYGWLDRGIRNVGAGKFLFGSDGFLNPMSVGIGPVVHAPVCDEDKRLILGVTMAQLLDRAGVLPETIRNTWLEGT